MMLIVFKSTNPTPSPPFPCEAGTPERAACPIWDTIRHPGDDLRGGVLEFDLNKLFSKDFEFFFFFFAISNPLNGHISVAAAVAAASLGLIVRGRA